MNSEVPEKNGAVGEVAAAVEAPPALMPEIPRYAPYRATEAQALAPVRIPRLNAALFFTTLLTTTMGGAYQQGADLSFLHPIESALGLANGLTFSLPLMAILLAHEMGHYITSRRNRVDASLPYFIPAPLPSISSSAPSARSSRSGRCRARAA